MTNPNPSEEGGMTNPNLSEDEKRALYHQEREAWIERGPIRRRRYALGQDTKKGRRVPLSQMDLAGGVGVNMLTIQNWEHGGVTPSRAGFKALANFFGDSNIRDEWMAWYRERPKPPKLNFGDPDETFADDDAESNADED